MSFPPAPPYGAPPPPVPGQAPRPPRPKTVTLAAAALIGEVVLLLIGVIVSQLEAKTITDASNAYNAAHNAPATNYGGWMQAASIASILVFIAYAVVLIALAWGILRGLQVVRILTWVMCGLFLCCTGFSAVTTTAVSSHYLPAGYLAYTYTATVLESVGFIATIVLLTLRPSNAYFTPQSQQQPF